METLKIAVSSPTGGLSQKALELRNWWRDSAPALRPPPGWWIAALAGGGAAFLATGIGLATALLLATSLVLLLSTLAFGRAARLCLRSCLQAEENGVAIARLADACGLQLLAWQAASLMLLCAILAGIAHTLGATSAGIGLATLVAIATAYVALGLGSSRWTASAALIALLPPPQPRFGWTAAILSTRGQAREDEAVARGLATAYGKSAAILLAGTERPNPVRLPDLTQRPGWPWRAELPLRAAGLAAPLLAALPLALLLALLMSTGATPLGIWSGLGLPPWTAENEAPDRQSPQNQQTGGGQPSSQNQSQGGEQQSSQNQQTGGGQPSSQNQSQGGGQQSSQGQSQGSGQPSSQGQPQGGGQQPSQGQPQGGGQQSSQGQPQGGGQQPSSQNRSQGGGQQSSQGQPQGGGQQSSQGQPQGGGQQSSQGRQQGGGQQQPQGQPQGDEQPSLHNQPKGGGRELGGAQPSGPGELPPAGQQGAQRASREPAQEPAQQPSPQPATQPSENGASGAGGAGRPRGPRLDRTNVPPAVAQPGSPPPASWADKHFDVEMNQDLVLRAPPPPARTIVLPSTAPAPAATPPRPFVPHQVLPGRADAIADR